MDISLQPLIAGVVALITIVASLVTILEYVKKHPLSIPIRLRRSKIKEYLKSQVTDIGNLLAAGTRDLYVRDILSGNALFIQPRWGYYYGKSGEGDLCQTLFKQVETGERSLLLGEPGLGKSTILKKVFKTLVEEYVQNRSKRIPIYIRLREVAFQTSDSITLERLWQILSNNQMHPFPLKLQEFCRFASQGKLVLLLDGLDEVQSIPNQTTINNLVTSEVFEVCNILTCRIYFYETYLRISKIDELYPEKIRLKNIKLGKDVEEFTRAFLERGQKTNTALLFSTIKKRTRLNEISRRPLLLVMMLDILTESPDFTETELTPAILYERYTLKCLGADAGKPGNIIRPIDKHRFMEDIAWNMIRESKFDQDADANFSTSITRANLIRLLEKFQTQSIGKLYVSCSLNELLEDILQYTFLYSIPGTDHYFFSHKTFQEFYAAKYVFQSLISDSDPAESVLKQHLPAEIAGILKELLHAKSLSDKEKNKIEAHLESVYHEDCGAESSIVREQACYYLACLGTDHSIQFLEQIIDKEPDLFVQRGILIGLGILCKRQDTIDRYLNTLHENDSADSINLGYHLIYYGDSPFESTYFDKKQKNCEGTIRAILRHLENEQYRSSWSLDMLTLRRLIETRAPNILEPDQVNKVKNFLKAQSHQFQPSFRLEYQLLQKTFKENYL